MLADAVTDRIASTKRRLQVGGVLQEVEWGIPGERDATRATNLRVFDAGRAH